MKLKLTRYPLVRMPDETQITLFLIKEELKSRKIFHALYDIGIDDCYFQPHLDSLIMGSIGLDDGSDKTFESYTDILDRRSRKIEADNDSIMKQALKAYHELMTLKSKLKSQNVRIR
ncbi:hypothetical protein [Pseudochryseolinea flava]|uniref:Uncharacterized protein n=1 Tax=Pseudochryseolinea flava TaxID=2059302 RepID=A0A364Y2T8_9BACT|nr:hypothetical protein [Pseudochryseolinea flava]RAW01090.1 hypothetical protein DQQ10_12745 [Pseudochryseolinea flava]